MAVQKRYRKLSLEEKKRRRATRRKAFENAPPNSFYHENTPQERVNERIECAVNRRAAGCYVRNF